LLVLFLFGCTNFEHLSYDIPETRALQMESLKRVSPRPIRGESIEDFFRDKVGLIVPEGRSFPSGRAVPISPDGYYLTAWHVVDEGGFFLSNFVSLKPLPVGEVVEAKEYYRDELLPGRLVWKDEKSDLAIVKFDFRPQHVFSLSNTPVQPGENVFSGAVGTNSGLLLISSGMRVSDGVGNGPYQTAGSVSRVRRINGEEPALVYYSDLVARGGMSGGAVVNTTGNLVGVLIQIRGNFLSKPSTIFAMPSVASIREIVARDRSAE
jgi:S1-C subfamily serine protease